MLFLGLKFHWNWKDLFQIIIYSVEKTLSKTLGTDTLNIWLLKFIFKIKYDMQKLGSF